MFKRAKFFTILSIVVGLVIGSSVFTIDAATNFEADKQRNKQPTYHQETTDDMFFQFYEALLNEWGNKQVNKSEENVYKEKHVYKKRAKKASKRHRHYKRGHEHVVREKPSSDFASNNETNNETTSDNKQPVENNQPKEAPVTPTTPTTPSDEMKEANDETVVNKGELNEFEWQVFELTNKERVNNGLQRLQVDYELSRVAHEKSRDMSMNNYFSHDSPVYGSPFDMMRSYGITYRTAGENIAMDQQTPAEVVQAWMNSPGHRANILNPNFTHIGIGYVAQGNYWTQQFIGK